MFSSGLTVETKLNFKVVRNAAFPDHRLSYTGKTSYRTLIEARKVALVQNVPDAVVFWHAPKGKWVYTCNLGGDVYEVTTMVNEPAAGKETVSWGQQAPVKRMLDHFSVSLCEGLFSILRRS